MVSKELLSEVLDTVTPLTMDITHTGNDLVIGFEYKDNMRYTTYKSINIYELAHLCKEWAFEQGKDLSVYRMGGFKKPTYACSVMLYDFRGRSDRWKRLGDCNSYTDGVFQATQWIYDDNERKQNDKN